MEMTNEELYREIEKLDEDYKAIYERSDLSDYDKTVSTPTVAYVPLISALKRNIIKLGYIEGGAENWTDEFIEEELIRLGQERDRVNTYKYISENECDELKEFFSKQIKRLEREKNKREAAVEFRSGLSEQGKEWFDVMKFFEKWKDPEND